MQDKKRPLSEKSCVNHCSFLGLFLQSKNSLRIYIVAGGDMRKSEFVFKTRPSKRYIFFFSPPFSTPPTFYIPPPKPKTYVALLLFSLFCLITSPPPLLPFRFRRFLPPPSLFPRREMGKRLLPLTAGASKTYMV